MSVTAPCARVAARRPGGVLAAPEAVKKRQRTRASIIVVSYNGRQYLPACLGSLCTNTGADDEIIVVDNASTDGSAGYVAETFPEVVLIRTGSNLGFGYGNNVGARRAQGRYLVFLNPDTVVQAGWLEPLLGALEANPEAGLVTSKVLLLADPARINACGNRVHFTGLTLCEGMGKESSAVSQVTEVGAVSGAAFAVRRDLFEALGGFDPAFFLYMEDTELSLRARLAGYRCFCVPQSVVYHDYSLNFGPSKTFYQERNRYLMLLKTLRWGTLAALLPALLLAEAVTWGFALLREPRRSGNKVRAYAWVIRHWQLILASRRETQRLRRVRDRNLLFALGHRLEFEQTGRGWLARGAHLVFDPLFTLLYWPALAVVWW